MADRFEHLLDSLAEAVVVIDRDLRIAYANPAWLERFGIPVSQVLGQTCHQVLQKTSTPCALDTCLVQQVFETASPGQATCPGYESTADDLPVEISTSPVYDSTGQVTEVIQILYEKTAEPAAEREPGLAPQERMDHEIADALRQVALITTSGEGLTSVLDAILDQLHRVVDYDSASITLADKRAWRIIAGHGFPAGVDIQDLVFPPDDNKIIQMQKTRHPLVVHDVQADENWIPVPGVEYIRSWIGAPLLVQDRMIGTLNVDKGKPGCYGTEDAQLVMVFANQAAVVIENARLLESERQRAAQLSLIKDISQQVLGILEPEALLEYAAEAIQSHFGYYHVDIFLTGPEGKYIVFQASSHPEYAARWREQGKRFRIGQEGITGHVAATAQAYVANDVRQDPHYFPDKDLPEARSELTVPIQVGDRILGILDLNSDQLDAFDENDLFVIQSLADKLALALENARLFEEARRRTVQLKVAADVARSATAILDVEQLLDETVHLISDRFGFYHAGVFLIDEEGIYAVLCAASSEGGQQMLQKGHKLPVGQVGIVGHVADTGTPRIALDVGQDAIHFANPDLLDTRSEMALPLISRSQVIGVLDVQSVHQAAFTDEDVAALQTMADQLANAIENARLFQETTRHVEELTALHDIDVAITSTLELDMVLERVYKQIDSVMDIDAFFIGLYNEEKDELRLALMADKGKRWPPETVKIEEEGGLGGWVVRSRKPLWIEDMEQEVDTLPVKAEILGTPDPTRSLMILPLVARDRVLGVISAQSYQPHAFDAGHRRLFSNIAGRVAIAIENAQLYQETQQRLKDLRLLFDSSATVSTSLDTEEVLHTTAQQAITAIGIQGCAISIWEEDQDVLVTWIDRGPDVTHWKPDRPGTVYSLADYPASRQVLFSGEPLVVLAGASDADPAELAWMDAQQVKALLMVPMIAGGKVIGLMELLEYEEERKFTPTEIGLCQTLANQTAAALENARLFQETEARVRELSALAAVGRAMITLELDQVLDSIAENALRAVRAEISSVYLLDQEKQQLNPKSVRGMRPSEYEHITFRLGEGTIGWATQTGEPLLVHDTADDEIFQTRSKISQRIRNSLTIPLKVKDQVIGALEVCNKSGARSFTTADQRLLTALAAQAAVAIENARLYQEVSHHLEEVSLLHRAASAATSTLEFGDVIRGSMTVLLGIRNFERVHVLIVDEVQGDLWLHPALEDLFPFSGSLRIPLGKGISGWVAQTGEPLRVADVHQEPRYIAGYDDTVSELAVPLRVGERIIGVLDVQSTRPSAFSESDQLLLTTLAGQLSTVLANVQLFEEARQRVRESTALVQVSQALNEAEDLNTILNIVLEETFDLVGSSEGSIILIDPPGSNRLRMVAERGLGSEVQAAFNDRPVYSYEGTYKRALGSGQIVEVSDITSDPDFLHDVGSRALSVTNIPLVTERGAIGLIAVDGLPKDDTSKRLLTALAGMAAVAIDKERLHQETSNRLAEVSTLYTLSTQITSSLSLKMVLESIVTILRLTLDCRACSIFLVDPTGEYLQLETASGPSADWKGVARLKMGEGVSGRVIAERRSIYVPDTQAEPGFIFFDPQIRSLLTVPLVVRDQAIGTLSIDDVKPNSFDNEIRLLTIAAAQAAVAIENAQLYESLQQSYTELEQAYNELRELDKMKSEFVQNISHELRTPLTFIKGYVELLQDGDMGDLNEDQEIAIGIVSRKAGALSQLVDDIISLQQANKERLAFEALSLAELGRAAVQAARASAMEAGITLTDEIPDGLASVLADKQRLNQVFDNLLGNAIKFSNPGDSVTVRMFEEDATIRTEVEDTGIGIPTEKLSRIFDRFYQVDGTTTRRFGGTGLGLAITKQIIEAHGGQVGVESEPDKGSLFYFTIPKAGAK